MKGRILIVDDELSMREFLSILLTREGYSVEIAPTAEDALALIARNRFDLILSDLAMPGLSGIDLLSRTRELIPPPELILITAHATAETAVEAMKRGAYDYIPKPFRVDELLLTLSRALERRNLVVENQTLRSKSEGNRPEGMVGESPPFRALVQLIDRVAPTGATVLVTGESGTGKELVARAIHDRSGAAGLFVPVNCGSIPETLMESELFGHVKGAFTGALQDHPGLFQQAHQGTIFLDEIGELPLQLQAKLLRVLQEREVRPVGASTPRSVQVRVICATNRDLEGDVRAGTFREDLFYRINVVRIHLPPLRERREDIPLLVDHICSLIARRRGIPPPRVTPEGMERLLSHPYPGNIRELENILEHALILDPQMISPATLPAVVGGEGRVTTPAGGGIIPDGFDLDQELARIEGEYLMAALQQSGGGKKRAAEILGISFRSLRYRLAKRGLADDGDEE
ncbi:MAG: sigma-54 dependent transcriptional regulator [Desulfuromonadia bacterium]